MSRSSTFRITRNAVSGATSNSTVPRSTGAPSDWVRSPGHDHAVEGRGDARARQLILDPRELRAHLVELRAQDLDLRGVALGHGLAQLLVELLLLAGPLQALELELAIVQHRQQRRRASPGRPRGPGASRM